jgi:hypothetical protein
MIFTDLNLDVVWNFFIDSTYPFVLFHKITSNILSNKYKLWGSHQNEVGTADDGNLYAISNQASPGGFFYRRSFADQLWGDDSPDFVQTKLSNWNDFLNVAAELKANDKKIVSNVNAAQKVFNRTREQRWVEDGKLVIDPQWNTYLDLTRTMQDEKYSNETVEYYPGGGWFSDISGNDVFGYFLAAWGLHYHLEANATLGDQTSENDWGFIQGPAPYFDGGTWFAGIKGTTVSNAVKDFLNYRAFDQDYLQAWALDKSDFSGNKLTVEAVENDFSNSFLQGQNPYPLFEEITESITGKNVSIYDGSIGAIFSECAVAYATRHSGYETLDKTWAQFKNTVRNTYPNIEIN